jgi:hypothetical protein
MLTMAMLDRMLHHLTIVNIKSESFILKGKRKTGLFSANTNSKRQGVQITWC